MASLTFKDGRRIKVQHYLSLKGKNKGHVSVYALAKPHVDSDYIFVQLARSRKKGEPKDKIGFSLNDYEALALADMLLWNVARRMKGRNVGGRI